MRAMAVLWIKLTWKMTTQELMNLRQTNRLKSNALALTLCRLGERNHRKQACLQWMLVGYLCHKNCQLMRVCIKQRRVDTWTTKISLPNRKRSCNLSTGYLLSSPQSRNIWHSRTTLMLSIMFLQRCSLVWWHYYIRNYLAPPIVSDWSAFIANLYSKKIQT